MDIADHGNDVYNSSPVQQGRHVKPAQNSFDNDDDDIDGPYPVLEEEYDSDIDAPEGPGTWSELVDKKVQRKMQSKDIKKQDVVYELVQTEALYVKTLYIMKKIYANGITQYFDFEPEIVNSMFPVLDDLIDLNGNFFRAMKKEQEEGIHYCIENIGEIILKTFDGENGQLFKEAYGYFCSRHVEAVALYKKLIRNYTRFSKFMKTCLLNDRTRRLSIPEIITYITIRLTKYPLLIEAIMKATKENSPDHEKLKRSLQLIKEILMGVDEHVDMYEQQKELGNLKKMIDKKNSIEIKNETNGGLTKYKASKLFHRSSRLLYDKRATLKSKNNKYHETRILVLADKIIFFQENGGKLQLLSVDNKIPFISLKKVMVREVATDIKALYLVNTSKESAGMYEISFEKAKTKMEFKKKMEKFISNCPEEQEEIFTDDEEEARREEEDRMANLKQFLEDLENKNEEISRSLENKNKIVLDLRKLLESMEEDSLIKGLPSMELKPLDVYNARVYLEDCLLKVNNTLLSNSNVNESSAPSPGQSRNAKTVQVHKKSDSFAGFERTKPPVSNSSGSGSPLGSSSSISSINVPALPQIQVYQQLSEMLGSLVEVTNKQDLELVKMHNKLQESNDLQAKTESELEELREKLILQQKESERQLRIERDNFAKLSREFKRCKEKNQQKLSGQPQRQLKANSEEAVIV